MVRGGLTEKVEMDRTVKFRFTNVGKLPPPVLQFTQVGCRILTRARTDARTHTHTHTHKRTERLHCALTGYEKECVCVTMCVCVGGVRLLG